MIRPTTLAAMWFLSMAGGALAAPAPTSGGSSAGVPLRAGDRVTFDLGGLPEKFEGQAKATCVGTRVDATGPVDARCERTFSFEVPAREARMTYVFRTAAGNERRIDLPIVREKRGTTFVAPTDGLLTQPSPIVLPEDAAEKAARSVGERECGACGGEGFRLEGVEVTGSPLPKGGVLSVKLAVTPAGK